MQALLSCSSAFTPESTQPGVDPDSSVTSSHVRSSYVDELLREFDKGQFGAPERVWVREGDRVLWPAEFRARLGTRPLSSTKGGDGDTSKAGIARHAADTPPLFAVMKLDVEGFECNTLRGMSALLSAGAVRTIKTEVFDNALRAQVKLNDSGPRPELFLGQQLDATATLAPIAACCLLRLPSACLIMCAMRTYLHPSW